MKTLDAVCAVRDNEKVSTDDADPHPLILEMSEPKKIQKIHQFSRKLTICEKKSPFDLKKTLSNSFKISRHSLFFLEKFFPEANRSDWNNWEWQIRNSITSLEQLKNIISLTDDEINYISQHKDYLPLRITPYYASLLDRYNAEHALRKTVIPASAENIKSIGEAEDPLSEDEQSPVPGLVHRYPDRVLFLTTGFCSTNCRYCTRSRVVSGHTNYCFDTSQWQAALSYIEKTKSIRDVLLSGGEVLTLSDENLEYLLLRLKKIKHIEIVRLGTKVPAVLPQRITRELVKMLKKYHPLWMNIHFTHPDEITPEVAEACSRLSDAGIPLGSQTVLLKNINDSVDTIKKLYHELLKIRVRPYYLYQCDPIIGSGHFRTSIEKGLEIIKGLRGFTTGFAVPHYVIDAPGGGGKTPILPEYYIGRENNEVILRNFEGNIYRYPDYNG